MFSFYNRGSTLLNFLCTVLPVLLALLACTSPFLLNQSNPDVKLDVRNVHMKRYTSSSTPSNKKERTMMKLYRYHFGGSYPPKGDIALIDFDINADLTSVFNWNVKELFVYLVYQFETPKQKFNQVVVWDDIITNKQDAHIKGKNVESEYLVTALDNKLRGISGNLTLYWDIIPNTGLLFQKSKGSIAVPLQKEQQE